MNPADTVPFDFSSGLAGALGFKWALSSTSF